jgi:hypothetical protein
MRARLGLVAALASLLLCVPGSAQVAGYQPKTFWGGYKEKQVRPGVWRITASYNAASGGGSAAAAAVNYRAAELMKAKGFAYLRVLKSGGFALGTQTGPIPTYGDGPGYAHITVRGATGPEDVAGCETRAKNRCETLAIEAVLKRWAGRVNR